MKFQLPLLEKPKQVLLVFSLVLISWFANAATITANITAPCVGTTVRYSAQAGSCVSFLWSYPASAILISGGGDGERYIELQWTSAGSGFSVSISGDCSGALNNITVVSEPSISTNVDPLSLTSNNLTLTANNGSNYQWRFSNALNTVLGTGATYVPTQGGTYFLTATRICGGTTTTSVNVNYFPVVDAGLDQSIALPTSYVLYGSGYDSDGDQLTYQWTQISGSALTLTNSSTPVLTLTSIVSGTFTFRLTVTDSYGKSSSDDVIVNASSIANNYSYVQSDAVLIPGQTTNVQVTNLAIGNKATSFSYADDLGRSVESVQVQSSPAGKDMVGFKVLDGLGREVTQYLPYTSSQTSGAFIPVSTATTSQAAFYNSSNDKIVDDASPYSTTKFEDSPLSRGIQQKSSGNYWQSNNITSSVSYGTIGAGVVLNWSIDATTGRPIAVSPYYYTSPVLAKTVATDEQNINSENYSDYQGRKILSRRDAGSGVWAETYYVYDSKNNLKFILPPQLVKVLKDANNFTPTQAQIDQWAFQYSYDNLNRPIGSKAPGVAWVYQVYDLRDRIILTQDGNQRNNNTWSYVKYDGLNRPVTSGIYSPGSSVSQSSMQSNADSYGNSTPTGATITLSSAAGVSNVIASQTIYLEPGFDFVGTSTSSMDAFISEPTGNTNPDAEYPVLNVQPLTRTYYDDYASCSVCQDSNFAFVNESWTTSSNEPYQNFTRVKGKIVGSSVLNLATNTWLNTVSYYNRHGQVIQMIGSNHLGGRDRISTLYDFSGKKLEEIQTTIGYNSGGVNTMRKVFTYDAAGRLLTTKHQINSQPMIILSALEYNELGQVVRKKLHSTDNGSTYIQNLDYRYNIHNALASVNNLPDDQDDYFGMDFTYEGTVSGTGAGNTPRKDGLISAIRWKQDLSSKKRLYNFTYDNLSRVTSSNHKMSRDNSLTWTDESDFYSESGISYDLNGNILSLNRNTEYFNGSTNSANAMDQLSYVYGSNGNNDNGNQLQYVRENSTTDTKDRGFKDGGTNSLSDPDYAYDANGNVTKDQNKGIASISYYFNNLPKQVTFNDGSYLQNVYDAAGIKLSQVYYAKVNGVLQSPVTTDYVGNIVLLNGQVLTINHSEGRITAPTYANLFTNPDAGSLDGYTPNQNVTLTSALDNGQTYVKAVCNQSTSTPGIFPISTTKGTSYTVKAGETYSFKVLGYQSVGGSASLYVKTNLGDLIWPGATLPVGSANENWVTASFTVPTNVTSVQFGVQWSAPANGNTFYINRVALYKTDFEYNYFITDQVGSTRVVLQTTPGTQVYTATMESQNQSTEAAKFLKMDAAQMVASPGNHTSGGLNAFKLNGAFPVGPAKSIKVYPGDQISAIAYSYYPGGATYNSNLASIAANVSTVFGGVAGAAGDPGAINQNVGTAYVSPGMLGGHSGSTTAPSAYLNYVLFDKDYNPIQGKSFPITKVAGQINPVSLDDGNGHSYITAQELGYIFIYLSYENINTNTGTEVYFDDFTITVQESNVIQVNNYYPFGMQSYTWLREGETDNAYLYQGKELIAQTGWHDFGSRMFYPDLGRWFGNDPQGNKMPYMSNYAAMMDNPVMFRDPDGECPICIIAVIAGVINVAAHWDQISNSANPWTTGAAAFGIGAAAGVIGAATGGAAFAALVGEGAVIGAGGFAAGALTSAFGSAFASPVMGFGNQALFGDPYSLNQFYTDVAFGAAFGGTINGIAASLRGANFWDGSFPLLSPMSAPAQSGLPISNPNSINEPEVKLVTPESTTGAPKGGSQGAGSGLAEQPQSVRLGKTEIARYYPDNSGFAGESRPIILRTGEILDRMGSESGRFLSPEGTPFPMRSLPAGSVVEEIKTYQVVKPFQVEVGRIAPWFGQPGGGIQIKAPVSVRDLIQLGYIKRIK